MTFHSNELYKSRESIPDVVSVELWLPPESRVRIPQAPKHTISTTTPVEVGYAFFELDAGGFDAAHCLLNAHLEMGGVPDNFLEDDWGNHLARIMLKAALDPDRLAPIDLVDAYHEETKARGFSEDEMSFLVRFTQDWGVLDRT